MMVSDMREPQPAPTTRDDRATRGRQWVEAVPVIVVVLVGVPILVLRPAIVQGTLGSPRALAITAGVTVAILGWSALLRRFAVPPAARSALVLLPIAVAGLLWIRPYFTDTRVDEQIPTAALASEPATQAPAPADTAAGPTTTPERSDRPTTPASSPSSEPAPSEPTPTPEPTKPVAETRGEFIGLDGHRAAGTAAVFRLPDGSLVVRLEDVDLQSVPEAYVHLVPKAEATRPGRRSLELGPLKGNVGSSNYRVPGEADVDPDAEWTVLVWCRPFASPVGAATQQPVG